jgi:hypothetical protein
MIAAPESSPHRQISPARTLQTVRVGPESQFE